MRASSVKLAEMSLQPRLLVACQVLYLADCAADTPQPQTADRPGVHIAAAESSPSSAAPLQPRPNTWAQPKRVPGLPNLHRVSDTLLRSAQPSAEGMAQLPGLGVRTVVNLRSLHSDRDELGDLALRYEHIHMKAWHPEDEDVVRFLRIVTDPASGPVLLHCQHGHAEQHTCWDSTHPPTWTFFRWNLTARRTIS